MLGGTHWRRAMKTMWLKVVIFGAVFCVVSRAWAVSQKFYYYHGSFCQPMNGSQSITGLTQWGISNYSSSSSATVICPIAVPYDVNLSSTPSGGSCSYNSYYNPIVSVYDRNSTTNVNCTLYSLFSDGSVFQSYSASSVGDQSASQDVGIGTTSTTLSRYLVVMCSLPPSTADGNSAVSALYFEGCGN